MTEKAKLHSVGKTQATGFSLMNILCPYRIKGDPNSTRHGKEFLACCERLDHLHDMEQTDSVKNTIKSVEIKLNKAFESHNKLIDEHQKGEQ